MAHRGHRPYPNADDAIPFGTYPRTQTALAALEDDDENILYEASDVLMALKLAEMATTTETSSPDPLGADA